MQGQPIIIKKSLFGLFVIFFVGISVLVLLSWMTFTLLVAHQLTPPTYTLLAVALVFVGLATLITAFVYTLSKIEITPTFLRVTNWYTIFFDNVAVCEWNQVEDVNVKQGGFFSQILNFGELRVQTAGTNVDLVMKMVPRPTYWQQVIDAKVQKPLN